MAGEHSPERQGQLVEQIAALIHQYRTRPKGFTMFELVCGLTFGPEPLFAAISVSPSKKEEQFRCQDKALLEAAGSERDAFFDAVDRFTASGAILAWNGKTPPGNFHLVRDMSLNFAHPTLSVEFSFQRKSETGAFKTKMFFIGFEDDLSANIYAGSRHALLK